MDKFVLTHEEERSLNSEFIDKPFDHGVVSKYERHGYTPEEMRERRKKAFDVKLIPQDEEKAEMVLCRGEDGEITVMGGRPIR